LATDGGMSFKALLPGKKRIREAMRLKSVHCEIVGRINDEKPLIGKPFEAEAGGVVADVALSFWVLLFAYALTTLVGASLTLGTYL